MTEMEPIALTYILYTVVLLAFSISLTVSYFESGRRRYILHWLIFGFFFTSAIASNAIPDIEESPALIAMAYLLFGVAYLNLDLGFAHYIHGFVSRSWRRILLAEMAFFIAVLGLSLRPDLFQIRFMVFNLWSAIIFGRIVICLFKKELGESSTIPWWSVLGGALLSLAWIVRGVIGLIVKSQSIKSYDAATITSTLVVSALMTVFSISLLNLAQQRMTRQLETVRTWMEFKTSGMGQANLVAGLAHSLGTPLGTAVLALSSHSANTDGEPDGIKIALSEIDRASRHLGTLRKQFLDIRADIHEYILFKEFSERFQRDAAAFGIAVLLRTEKWGSVNYTGFHIGYSSFLGQIVDLFDLATASGWVARGDERRIILENSPISGIVLEGLFIPDDVWIDAPRPMRRTRVGGFTETLMLSGILAGLRSHPAVQEVYRDETSGTGLRIELKPDSTE